MDSTFSQTRINISIVIVVIFSDDRQQQSWCRRCVRQRAAAGGSGAQGHDGTRRRGPRSSHVGGGEPGAVAGDVLGQQGRRMQSSKWAAAPARPSSVLAESRPVAGLRRAGQAARMATAVAPSGMGWRGARVGGGVCGGGRGGKGS